MARGGDLPTGAVTFLNSDLEGSTALLSRLGERYGEVLYTHRRLLREVWAEHDGLELSTEGDAFLVVFVEPVQALLAAAKAQRVLAAQRWPEGESVRVRMGVHTGVPRVRDGEYWGIDIHYVVRLCTAANGGQVLVSAATASLVSAELEDLGEHALKDFPTPRRVFHLVVDGLGAASFPRPRTLRAGQTNLPEQISSFVGRERELSEVRELLASSRLVTLTGTGGVGKTRLAVRVGSELLDGTGDGVWFVDLAAVSDPAGVPAAVAAGLRVTLPAGASALEILAGALEGRNLLVVIDNCEQVVGAVAPLVEGLLLRCNGVSVLATSREPLRVTGEEVYRVPSLATPTQGVEDAESVRESDAVRLFVERAGVQRAGLLVDGTNAALLARVCRRLDGIPLAIELAAVRVRSLSLAELDARLDHRLSLLRSGARTAPQRQQTLRALIDWSYELLTAPERTVLARLSVFAGSGFDLEAAEAVGDPDGVDALEVIDVLDELVAKNLLVAEDISGAVRYRLLETVREYAAAKLAAEGAPGVAGAKRAHLHHYSSLAESVGPMLRSAERRTALDRLWAEYENLLTALDYCLESGDVDPGLRLAGALTSFWHLRGGAAEIRPILERLLTHPAAQDPTLGRARALVADSEQALVLWEIEPAIARAQEGLEIARRHHEPSLVAEALYLLAFAEYCHGEAQRALEHAEEGIAVAGEVDDASMLAALHAAAAAALDNLDADSRPAAEHSLAYARQSGNPHQIGFALRNLGYLNLIEGEPAQARVLLEEAVAIQRDLGQPWEVVEGLMEIALADLCSGDREAAEELLAEQLPVAQRLGHRNRVAWGLLSLALAIVDDTVAASLHGAAEAEQGRVGLRLDPLETRLRDADQRRRQAALGERGFQAAYDFGRGLDANRALAFALSGHPGSPVRAEAQ
jgi:predicted ATPase/class 3 adenylate cyclase